MWFKRVLLAYYATFVAVTADTAADSKDATVLKSHHQIESLVFPSLERRRQPDGNETSVTESSVSTSKDTTSSTVLELPKTTQTSTSIAVSTTESLPESTTAFSSTSTQSGFGPSSTSITLSSSNVEVSITSLRSYESTTPSSSALEPRTSQISRMTLSSFLHLTNSQPTIASTFIDITSIMSSYTEELRSLSSVVAVTNSKPGSVAVPTAVLEPVPSTAGLSLSVSSTPTSTEGSSITQSLTTISSTRESVSTVDSVDLGSSVGSTPLPSSLVPEASSKVVSTATLMPQSSNTVTTSKIQEFSSSIGPSSEVADLPISSVVFSVASSTASAPITSTAVTLASNGFSIGKTSSAASESTTVITSSILETSAVMQTPTPSKAASSILVSTIFAPPAASFSESATGTFEEARPAPSSAIWPTLATSSSPIDQLPSSTTAKLSSATSGISTEISIQFTDTTITLSSMTPISSSQVEHVTTVSEQPVLPNSRTTSQSDLPLSALTTITESNVALAPTSISQSITMQTSQSPSEVGPPVTSLVEATSTVSIPPSLPTSAVPSSTTVVQPGSSGSPISGAAPSGFSETTKSLSASSATGILSSTTIASEVTSLLPSEAIATSASSSMVSSTESSIAEPHISASGSTISVTLSPTRSASSGLSFSTTGQELLTLTLITAFESHVVNSKSSSPLVSGLSSSSLSSIPSGSSSTFSSLSNVDQSASSQRYTTFASPSTTRSANATIPTSETTGSSFMSGTSTSIHASVVTTSSITVSSFVPAKTMTRSTNDNTTLPLSIKTSGSQATLIVPTISGTVTATFPTIYVSSARSSILDLSTVAFSLFSSATGAEVSFTQTRYSSDVTSTMTSQSSGTHITTSETLLSSSKLEFGVNLTSTTQLQSVTATIGISGSTNSTRTSTSELGITFSRSAVPTGTTGLTARTSDATHAETLETSSAPVAISSKTATLLTSIRTDIISSSQSNSESVTSTSSSDEASSTSFAISGETQASATHHAPTSTPSQAASAGSPPPLTTSQTAGVAVGATTGLLIAVVAAIFIARRYHAAKHGRRASTGSIYPKVAYLYDPKTGGDGGDAEALMSGATGGPSDPVSGAARGASLHTQRRSTGTMPVARFTSPGNPFRETGRDPAVHRYSGYARVDTARALSAAVAGYGGTPDHTSFYTKYPSEVTNPFSDHVIPSPTFAPFSPDDIRRPELKTPRNVDDGRGEYLRMATNSYAYLNPPASMYPPISPYGHQSTTGPSSANDTRRQTIDSDPFADPFEHDLLLHVDEQNRTSDSVTIFAPSPNLKTPRTPRTPLGPKLPVRQPNGMTSARSLLSPVAAKYLHRAHEVKIPRKSVASPVLVQVGRSPVIKPFSPPPAAPEPLGWDDIKRNSEKDFSDEQSVPAPLKVASPVIKKKPVPASHTRTKPSLTGAGHTLLVGNGLPLTVKIPHRYSKSVGLDISKMHRRPDLAHEELSSDPVVREKRSRELRFANPALIGKDF